MTLRLDVQEAKLHHIGRLVRRMRTQHVSSLLTIGVNVHRELHTAFHASYYRRTAFLEGEIFALWGCTGSFLSPAGIIWLAIAKVAEQHPILLLKEARRQMDAMMVTKRELTTHVIGNDEAAKRFTAFLGFHVDHTPLGEAASSKWARRSLLRYMDETPELRYPVGNGFVVRMGYHQNSEAV